MYHKTNTITVSVLLVFCCGLLACAASKSYFNTPNDVLKTPATITLTNGTVRTGLLTILFENDIDTSGSLLGFTPADSTKEETLNFSDIRSYRANGSTYVAKYVNLYSNGTLRGLFVKCLSADSSAMQLYQLEQHYKSNAVGESRDYYYVSVPAYSTSKLIELQSTLLVPAFESKMAAYLLDCPPLAEKIRNGTKGYSYNFLTATYKKVEVIKNIIEEYDLCKAKSGPDR